MLLLGGTVFLGEAIWERQGGDRLCSQNSSPQSLFRAWYCPREPPAPAWVLLGGVAGLGLWLGVGTLGLAINMLGPCGQAPPLPGPQFPHLLS